MCMSSVGNVIYHKFSHGAAFYMLNGKNVNVMLEFTFTNAKLVIYKFLKHILGRRWIGLKLSYWQNENNYLIH